VNGCHQNESPTEMRQGFYSPYFIVPKKGGGLWTILDLRVLNRALHKLPFKMLTHRRMIKCIQPQDWFAAPLHSSCSDQTTIVAQPITHLTHFPSLIKLTGIVLRRKSITYLIKRCFDHNHTTRAGLYWQFLCSSLPLFPHYFCHALACPSDIQ